MVSADGEQRWRNLQSQTLLNILYKHNVYSHLIITTIYHRSY